MTGKPTASPDSPRFAPLRAWLERINAALMYEAKSPNRNVRISIYAVNGRVFIVTTTTMGEKVAGWDIYVPASTSNHVGLTLDSAAIALGVDGCRGLVDEAA